MPPGTYTLYSPLPHAIDLGVSAITIQGSGYDQTFIDGNNTEVNGPWTVQNANVWDLTIQNFQGNDTDGTTAITTVVPAGWTASFNYVRFFNNGNITVAGSCSAISNYGTVYLNSVDISSSVPSFAGVVCNQGSIYADSLTIHDTSAQHDLVQNSGGYLDLANSTIGNCNPGSGAIIHNTHNGSAEGVTEIYNSTIAFNTGIVAGKSIGWNGILNDSTGTAAIEDSIVFYTGFNTNVCSGTITSYGHNVLDKGNQCVAKLAAGDQVTSNPVIGSGMTGAQKPTLYGSIGPVYMPLPKSPVLGSADTLGTWYDGRGAYRNNSIAPAVGAVQPSYATLIVHNNTALSTGETDTQAAVYAVFGGSGWVNTYSDTWNGVPAPADGTGPIVIAGNTNVANIQKNFPVATTHAVLVLNQNVYNVLNMTAGTAGQGVANTTWLNDQWWDQSGYYDAEIGFVDGTSNTNIMYPDDLPNLTSQFVNFGWGTPETFEYSWGMGISGHTNEFGFIVIGYGETMFNNKPAPATRWGLFANDAAVQVLNPAGTALLQSVLLGATNPYYDGN